MNDNIKVVAEGHPEFVEMLEAYSTSCKDGDTYAVAIVSIEKSGEIHANWYNNGESSTCELLGATYILQTKMENSMKGKE